MNTNCAILVIADKISHCGILDILIIKRKLNGAMIRLVEKDFHLFIENVHGRRGEQSTEKREVSLNLSAVNCITV
jgi:hypothetical protein